MMTASQLVFYLIVLAVLGWAIEVAVPGSTPIKRIITVVLVILALFLIGEAFGLIGSWPLGHAPKGLP